MSLSKLLFGEPSAGGDKQQEGACALFTASNPFYHNPASLTGDPKKAPVSKQAEARQAHAAELSIPGPTDATQGKKAKQGARVHKPDDSKKPQKATTVKLPQISEPQGGQGQEQRDISRNAITGDFEPQVKQTAPNSKKRKRPPDQQTKPGTQNGTLQKPRSQKLPSQPQRKQQVAANVAAVNQLGQGAKKQLKPKPPKQKSKGKDPEHHKQSKLAASSEALDVSPQDAAPEAKADADVTPAADNSRRTVFVGHLPVAYTPAQLKKLFRRFGAIQSVRLRSVPVAAEGRNAKRPRKAKVLLRDFNEARATQNAYVVFAEEEAAEKAVEANMEMVEGRHIRVDRLGQGGKAVDYEPSRSVFLGNLPFDVEEEAVQQLIEGCRHLPELGGQVEAVRVVRDPDTQQGRGIAFVLLKSTAAAKVALSVDGQKLEGREVRVQRVKPHHKPQVAQKAGKAARGQAPRGRAAPGGAKRRLVEAQRQGGTGTS